MIDFDQHWLIFASIRTISVNKGNHRPFFGRVAQFWQNSDQIPVDIDQLWPTSTNVWYYRPLELEIGQLCDNFGQRWHTKLALIGEAGATLGPISAPKQLLDSSIIILRMIWSTLGASVERSTGAMGSPTSHDICGRGAMPPGELLR